jgi:hypothetical protein
MKPDSRTKPADLKGVPGNCLLGALGLWQHSGGCLILLILPAGTPWAQRFHWVVLSPDGLVYDFTFVNDELRRGWMCGPLLYEGWVRVRPREWWSERVPSFPRG